MVKTRKLPQDGMGDPMSTADTQRKRRAGKYRCGFCLDGRHENCCRMTYWTTNRQLYTCPCECNADRTRCTRCRRWDQEVTTDTGRCVDATDCSNYLASRHLRSEWELPAQSEATRERRERRAANLAAQPAAKPSGSCLCCGEPTKGGKFLPGHDARYISATAAVLTDSATPPELLTATLDVVDTLSPVLVAKLTKRIAAIRAAEGTAS